MRADERELIPTVQFSLLTSHFSRIMEGMTGWLSSSAGGQLRFETTQWSLVSAAAQEEERRSALESLYRSYCSPVYFFIRRRGYRRQDAQDLTQDFFVHLVQKNAFRRADPNRGKFRTFLLAALEFFLLDASKREGSEKRGGQTAMIFLDDEAAETQYQLIDPGLSAEQIFDARWVGTLIENALARLQAEMSAAGKEELFKQIWSFVTGGEDSSYAQVAQRTGLSLTAAKAAIHRLRERYREHLRAEIARTVTTFTDFDDEIRTLRKLVFNRPTRR
jgi:RNA polymerase sigma factor (sigma-70 family)